MTSGPCPEPAGDFYWAEEPWGPALRCRALDDVAPHLFTTRALELRVGGPLSAGWMALAASLGVEASALVRLRQVHGCSVVLVAPGEVAGSRAREIAPAGADAFQGVRSRDDLSEADVLVSSDPTRAIVVQAADCVPILLADPVTGLVGAVHAGWRGTLARAVVAGVAAMRDAGARPSDIVAAIGPSIGACCYEVGDEVRDAFVAQVCEADTSRWFVEVPNGRARLDLVLANRDQLVSAGLRVAHVHACRLCTACHLGVFYSFRREREQTGRLAAAIRARTGAR